MKNHFLISLVCLIFVFFGCEPSFYTLTNNEHVYPATQPSSIKVTTNEKIKGEYSEIGYIFANGGTINACIENLKLKAAELGGTAVIKFQINVVKSYLIILIVPIPSVNYYAQGVVVKQ